MDRNIQQVDDAFGAGVALRKESVDRNQGPGFVRYGVRIVALRKESVDRNCLAGGAANGGTCVALRKESVDRNLT